MIDDGWDEWHPEMSDDGCCFPGECLMPGPHFRSECHTVEMIEAQEDQP